MEPIQNHRDLGSLAIDDVGAVLESFRKLAKSRFKHSAHEKPESGAPEFIGDAKLYEAGLAFVAIMKNPPVFEVLERSVDIFHENLVLRAFAGDAAREGLADGPIADLHIGDERQYASIFVAPPHPQSAAKRHESRIGFDVGHKFEHFGGAMADPAAGMK